MLIDQVQVSFFGGERDERHSPGNGTWAKRDVKSFYDLLTGKFLALDRVSSKCCTHASHCAKRIKPREDAMIGFNAVASRNIDEAPDVTKVSTNLESAIGWSLLDRTCSNVTISAVSILLKLDHPSGRSAGRAGSNASRSDTLSSRCRT